MRLRLDMCGVSIPNRREVQPHLQAPSAAPVNVFTLIELSAVIAATIATLAALLLPALSRSKTQALLTVCMGNEKQFQVA